MSKDFPEVINPERFLDWKELALTLREELNRATDTWVPRVYKAFGIGIAFGAFWMWLIIYYHWY